MFSLDSSLESSLIYVCLLLLMHVDGFVSFLSFGSVLTEDNIMGITKHDYLAKKFHQKDLGSIFETCHDHLWRHNQLEYRRQFGIQSLMDDGVSREIAEDIYDNGLKALHKHAPSIPFEAFQNAVYQSTAVYG